MTSNEVCKINWLDETYDMVLRLSSEDRAVQLDDIEQTFFSKMTEALHTWQILGVISIDNQRVELIKDVRCARENDELSENEECDP